MRLDDNDYIMPISRHILHKLYIEKKKSSAEICKILKCSERTVNYWISAYGIPKRSISEAIYLKYNPNGDPFKTPKPKNIKEAILFGLGLGLYWGEGNKRNKNGLRLGNTDPRLLKKFIQFLTKMCGVDRKKLRLGLQIFSDSSPQEVKSFWKKTLNFGDSSFQKVIITPSRGIGTYKKKAQNGVLTVQYYNKKLRDIICAMLDNLK